MSKANNNEDVEMIDTSKKTDAKKETTTPKEEPLCRFYGKYIFRCNQILELKKVLVLLEKAAKEKDFKMAGSLTK
jgi:hypothetical protein